MSEAERKAEVALTAIVVVFNEVRRLDACLRSLRQCDQVIVVDLGSRDASLDIARRAEARIVQHSHVRIVEHVLPEALALADGDWILHIDPDEVMPDSLLGEIRQRLADESELACLEIPLQNYFFGYPLTTTVWGAPSYPTRVLHRGRVEFDGLVHSGVRVLPGYVRGRIEARPGNLVDHYWADAVSQMVEKHRRYIALEGEAAYTRGARFSWRRAARDTRDAFRHAFVWRQGYRGGWRGWFLSAFYTWYIAASALSLRRYCRAAAARILACGR